MKVELITDIQVAYVQALEAVAAASLRFMASEREIRPNVRQFHPQLAQELRRALLDLEAVERMRAQAGPPHALR